MPGSRGIQFSGPILFLGRFTNHEFVSKNKTRQNKKVDAIYLDMGFLPNMVLPAIQTAISNLPAKSAKTANSLLFKMHHTKV